MRVASFNVRNRDYDAGQGDLDWSVRVDVAAQHIVSSGADIVGLQESNMSQDTVNGQTAQLLDAIEALTGVRWKQATYSQVHSFIWNPNTIKMVSKAATRVDIAATNRRIGYARMQDLETGKDFLFLNTHFPLTAAERVVAVGVLIDTIVSQAKLPVVIAGDFNDSGTGSTSVYGRLKAKGYLNTRTTDAENGGLNSFNGFDPTMAGKQSGKWIDGVLATKDIHIAGSGMYLEYESGETLPLAEPLASDHSLVWSDLLLVAPLRVEPLTVESRTGVVSDAYLEAVVGSHEVLVRADVYHAGEPILRNLPVVNGAIVCSQTSAVRRMLTLTVSGELRQGAWDSISSTPLSSDHPLSHHGQEVRIRHGLKYPDGSVEWVPVGRFRIEGHSGADLLGRGPVTITGLSFEAYVEEARFPKPRTVEGHSAVRIIQDLVREVLPGATFRVGISEDRRVPKTTFDRDRWDAIQSLADSLAAVVYTDGRGTWCIDPAVTTQTPSLWRLRGGHGGTLIAGTSSSDRAGVYNEAVVTNDNATTDVKPVFASVRDENPLSPTRWGDPDAGAFGKVTTFLEIPTLTTEKQAYDAAQALLGRSTGRSHSFNLEGIPLAPMEAGDVVDVETLTNSPTRATVFRHIVDEYTLPLGPGGAFSVVTRNIGEVV